MTTRIVTPGTMAAAHTPIPTPDLINLIRTYLPGELGIPVLWSLHGGLNFRIASLAGMIANALASDNRKRSATLDSYNDHMSHLESLEAARQSFEEAGSERRDLITDLRQLIAFQITVVDYMASAVGETRLPETNWMEVLERASMPRPVSQSVLDIRWNYYVRDCKEEGVEQVLTREEYDAQSRAALSGERAAWSKHMMTVLSIIEAANDVDAIPFDQLNLRTQLSLLMKYAAEGKEARKQLRDSILKTFMKRPTSPEALDANIRLRYAFADACHRATLHHRYAKVGDALHVAVDPVVKSPVQIAEGTKARANPHADLIAEAVKAESLEDIQKATAMRKAMVEAATATKKREEAKAKREAKAALLKSKVAASEILADATPNDI